MALRAPGLSLRFFVALIALLGAFAVAAVVALHGLDSVQAANEQVYADNFRTSAATSELAVDLARVESLSLRLATGPEIAEAASLRTELHESAIPQVNADVTRLLQLHAGDPPAERAQIRHIPAAWTRFRSLAGHGFLASPAAPAPGDERANAVSASLEPLITFVRTRQATEAEGAADAHEHASTLFRSSRTWLWVTIIVAIAAAAAELVIGLRLRKLVDRQSADQAYAHAEGEYIETLQVTENEEEAQELLRRHLERSLPESHAVVLTRNNSADRLEPKTSLDQLAGLRDPLIGATPRSCLAVRFAKEHVEGGVHEPLLGCQICGGLSGISHCEPLLVGGEVIGAVLINQNEELDLPQARRIRETVGQAAPVLANLRNLALAKLRAATDELTGLPNQRAVQDTLKRMVAQASRTVSPLSALLLDLDHFKQINDIHGHERGDEALASVGVTLRNVVRDSDFVGRYGGEEFLLLLPSTDMLGARHVAEAVRQAVAEISIPHLDRALTVSIGMAAVPDHAGDAVTLFRAADRALYAAKRNGRNRVETATFEDTAADEDLDLDLPASSAD